MITNGIVRKSISLLALSWLIGCGGSNGSISSKLSETDNSSVTDSGGGGF